MDLSDARALAVLSIESFHSWGTAVLRNRIHWLCLVLGLLAGCSQGARAPEAARAASNQQIATFEGEFDPATGKISITTISGAGLAAVELPGPVSDGTAGSGANDTFELVTEASPEPGVVAGGCGAVDSFEGSITLRSFYTAQTFNNVFIQLTAVSPSGFEACNSDSGGGYSAAMGLWSYGTLGTRGSGSNAATKHWMFKFPTSQRFTFRGRILGDYSTPEFDWTPAAIGWPAGQFQEEGTTLAHIVWNGTTFADTRGQITFVQNSADDIDNIVNLWTPAEHWQGPFTNGAGGNWFVASQGNGGNAVDTSGTFTACVKFKPGTLPIGQPTKVLFGKGQAETPVGGGSTYEGWALMEMHDLYCFHYKTVADADNTMSYVNPSTTTPEAFTYDYLCGGRDGDDIRSMAHGRTLSTGPNSGGWPVFGTHFASPASLPLVIGAYPDGAHAALDGGVYEVIIDSRAPTAAVMNEIVARAEGTALAGSVDGSAIYLPPQAAIVAPPGGYTLPPYATTPLASGGSPLPAGTTVTYTHPLFEDTSATGFCVGAVVTASGAWAGVSGGLLDFGSNGFGLSLNPFTFENSGNYTFNHDDWSVEPTWASGSTHTFKACAEPYGVGTPHSTLYLDGVAAAGGLNPAAISGAITDLSDPAGFLVIGAGTYRLSPLAGASITRVFACPTSIAADCN
jgi:hypothetical protein